MDGVHEVQALLDQYNAVMAKWSEPDADYEAIGAEQSVARGPDQRRRRLERRAQRRDRDGGAALPARRRRRRRRSPAARSAASRSPGSCSGTRTCCSSTSRRTTSTPSRSSGSSASSTSTRAPSSPSPTTATSSTTSRSGSSSSTAGGASRSPATTRAGSSRSSSGCRSEQKPADARQRTLARELEWVRMGAEGPPGEGQGAAVGVRAAARRGERREGARRASSRSRSRPGRASATRSSRSTDLRKGYGDRLLIEDLTFSLPRSGIVGIIGPNGAGKTTLFRMLVGQEAPDAGTIEIGDTVKLSYVDQGRDELRADKTVFQEITDGVEVVKVGNREVPARAYVSIVQLPRHGPAEARRDAVGRRAEPRPPREAAPAGRQRPAARRADERPRRRHAARARGRPRVVPRLRRRHQPRPLVPRPDRDPHPRVRGRQPGPLLRGQRQRLRGVPPQGARHVGRPAAPDPVQAPRRLTARERAGEIGRLSRARRARPCPLRRSRRRPGARRPSPWSSRPGYARRASRHALPAQACRPVRRRASTGTRMAPTSKPHGFTNARLSSTQPSAPGARQLRN